MKGGKKTRMALQGKREKCTHMFPAGGHFPLAKVM